MTLDELDYCDSFPDLTFRGIKIIFCLRTGKKCVRDVARELKISKPAISRAFDNLTKNGLMIREREPYAGYCNESDRRNVWGVITDKGREFAERISG